MDEDISFVEQFIQKIQGLNLKVFSQTDIKLEKEIGRGYFGRVYKSVITDSQEVVAVKNRNIPLNKRREWDSMFEQILNEVNAIVNIKHEKVPKFLGLLIQQNEKIDAIGIVISYVDGQNLHDYLDEDDNDIDINEIISIIRQITIIVKDIHEQNIIHRDIKPYNLMITTDKIVYLVDFGTTKIDSKSTNLTSKERGSTIYAPPGF